LRPQPPPGLPPPWPPPRPPPNEMLRRRSRRRRPIADARRAGRSRSPMTMTRPPPPDPPLMSMPTPPVPKSDGRTIPAWGQILMGVGSGVGWRGLAVGCGRASGGGGATSRAAGGDSGRRRRTGAASDCDEAGSQNAEYRFHGDLRCSLRAARRFRVGQSVITRSASRADATRRADSRLIRSRRRGPSSPSRHSASAPRPRRRPLISGGKFLHGRRGLAPRLGLQRARGQLPGESTLPGAAPRDNGAVVPRR
jgi:hypothetical protein